MDRSQRRAHHLVRRALDRIRLGLLCVLGREDDADGQMLQVRDHTAPVQLVRTKADVQEDHHDVKRETGHVGDDQIDIVHREGVDRPDEVVTCRGCHHARDQHRGRLRTHHLEDRGHGKVERRECDDNDAVADSEAHVLVRLVDHVRLGQQRVDRDETGDAKAHGTELERVLEIRRVLEEDCDVDEEDDLAHEHGRTKSVDIGQEQTMHHSKTAASVSVVLASQTMRERGVSEYLPAVEVAEPKEEWDERQFARGLGLDHLPDSRTRREVETQAEERAEHTQHFKGPAHGLRERKEGDEAFLARVVPPPETAN